LDEFVAQEEACGVGPISKQKLDAAIKKIGDYTAEIKRSNIAFVIARWFDRNVNSSR